MYLSVTILSSAERDEFAAMEFREASHKTILPEAYVHGTFFSQTSSPFFGEPQGPMQTSLRVLLRKVQKLVLQTATVQSTLSSVQHAAPPEAQPAPLPIGGAAKSELLSILPTVDITKIALDP